MTSHKRRNSHGHDLIHPKRLQQYAARYCNEGIIRRKTFFVDCFNNNFSCKYSIMKTLGKVGLVERCVCVLRENGERCNKQHVHGE